MTRARILQEVRQMQLEELYERRQRRDVIVGGVGRDSRGDGADVSPIVDPRPLVRKRISTHG